MLMRAGTRGSAAAGTEKTNPPTDRETHEACTVVELRARNNAMHGRAASAGWPAVAPSALVMAQVDVVPQFGAELKVRAMCCSCPCVVCSTHSPHNLHSFPMLYLSVDDVR
jgi:hypothetical protein